MPLKGQYTPNHHIMNTYYGSKLTSVVVMCTTEGARDVRFEWADWTIQCEDIRVVFPGEITHKTQTGRALWKLECEAKERSKWVWTMKRSY